jgi:phosphate-selective porin OprO/OprP
MKKIIPGVLALGVTLLAPWLAAHDAPVPGPPTPTATPVAPPSAPTVSDKQAPLASAEGFFIQSQNGDYKLQVRGYAQADARVYVADEGQLGVDTFVLRRVRPSVQGTVARHFEFVIMPDFGAGSAVLQDAFLDVKYGTGLRLRVGKFKVPVGLERLQSGASLVFVERALPTALVPNRDVGVQVHGELTGGVLAYAVGLFNGGPDGGGADLDVNDSKDLAARVFVSPFKRGRSPLKNLGFGVAFTSGQQTGALPSYRSAGQLAFFSYGTGVSAGGLRRRLMPQLSFYRGPLGLLAEYVRTNARVQRVAGNARSEARLSHSAWQVAANYALGGDEASYAGLRPRRAFDPHKGQWGAFELAARLNGLALDADTFVGGWADPTRAARKALAWGLGVNWYLNRHVKQQLDFERTTYTAGAAPADGGRRKAENALLLRSQVSF